MRILLLCLLPPLLAGCDFFSRNDGRLDLAITDAPVDDATAVVVRFTGVELRHEDGEDEIFEFDVPRDIDLLALSGGDSELLLSGERLPSGRYERIRLRVESSPSTIVSRVETLGGSFPLYVPDDAEDGLDLDQDFDVPDDERAAYTIDFDLRRSMHNPESGSNAYELRPVLRLVEDERAGSIGGTVNSAKLVAGCVPAVYVYSGSSITPDDVDGSGTEPVSSARVNLSTRRYTVAFLPEGKYTVAFTCDADEDDPATNDSLTFEAKNASVEAGETRTVNF
jgi:hypothetical protein